MLLPEFNSVRPFNLQLQKCKQIWYYIYFKVKTKSPYLGLPAVTWDPVPWKKQKNNGFSASCYLQKKTAARTSWLLPLAGSLPADSAAIAPHSTPVGTHRSQRRTERSIHSWNFLVQWEYKFNKSTICIIIYIYTFIKYKYICWKHLHSFIHANM